MKIEIREAIQADARLVAYAVLRALDMGMEEMERFVVSCSDENAMYSWKDSFVAEVDGKPAGCLIAYEGSRYKALRERTWPRLWLDMSEDELENVEIEAFPGEYFLDSLAILPEFRGHDIGKRLLQAALDKGRRLGCHSATLMVDVNKPKLCAYYQSMGFGEYGLIDFFGHTYKRMKVDYDVK